MRYITLNLEAPDTGFHPANQLLANDPAIQRGAIHYIDLIADGTSVLLYQIYGDLNRAMTLLSDSESVLSVDVVGTDEGLVYLHTLPTSLTKTLLAIPRNHGVVLETPVKFVPSGGAKITFAGEEKALNGAVAAIPPEVKVSLERTGTYHPSGQNLVSLLTNRQREVLWIAVTDGYFESPRATTLARIADRLDLSKGTVGEHLRKIEAKILPLLVT